MIPRGSPPGSSSATRLVSARRSPARGRGSAWTRTPTRPSRLPWRPMPSVAPSSIRRTGCWSSGRAALLYPLLPEFETLRACLDGMRRAWRGWADAWAREFSALCMARGFLPGAGYQQRTLFDEVVRPLAAEPGADRVLRCRCAPVRDGRGALPSDGRHAGDHRDAAAPARRASHRDGGGDERARARRAQRPPADLAGGRRGRCPGLPGG